MRDGRSRHVERTVHSVQKDAPSICQHDVAWHHILRKEHWRRTDGRSAGVATCSCDLSHEQVANDFLTSFVPSNNANTVIGAELPDLTTCVNCPDIAYSMLTGKEKDDATVEEVQALLYQALAAKSGGNAHFKIVESEFIRALQHGWLVEVQECSRIRDSGILTGLNEYDRAGARIPLCNGEFATRHEDALVLYTDNVGYNSCRPLDPSVLRRMSVIVDSAEMAEETVLNRVRYNVPGFNEVLLKKMYSVWTKIQKFCQEQGIDGGCCSVSELEMWVACVAMDDGENVIENCQSAVIGKTTTDPVDQAAILAAVKTMGCPESIRDIISTTPIYPFVNLTAYPEHTALNHHTE